MCIQYSVMRILTFGFFHPRNILIYPHQLPFSFPPFLVSDSRDVLVSKESDSAQCMLASEEFSSFFLLHAVIAQSSTSLGVSHLFGKAKAELFAKPFLHSPLNLYFYS